MITEGVSSRLVLTAALQHVDIQQEHRTHAETRRVINEMTQNGSGGAQVHSGTGSG